MAHRPNKHNRNKLKAKAMATPTQAVVVPSSEKTEEVDDVVELIETPTLPDVTVITPPSAETSERLVPTKIPIPSTTENNRPNIVINRTEVEQYNRFMVRPGDVVFTEGVLSDDFDTDSRVIGKSHRPILVIWTDGNVARGIPLSTSPGIEGSVTGNRRSAIPSTPELARKNVNSISYLDHGQITTFDVSSVRSIPLTLRGNALDDILLEDIKMTYIEQNRNTVKLLEMLYNVDPDAFKLYQDRTELDNLMLEHLNLIDDRNRIASERNALNEKYKKSQEALKSSQEELRKNREQLSCEVSAKNNFQKLLEEEKTKVKVDEDSVEKIKALEETIRRQNASMEAMKQEIEHLKTLKKKQPVSTASYTVDMAAAVYNAYNEADRIGDNRYKAMCAAIGLEYDPDKSRTYGQVKRQLRTMLVNANLISEAEWQ